MDLGIILSENFYNLDVDQLLLNYLVESLCIEITSFQLSFIFIYLSTSFNPQYPLWAA